MVSHYVRLLGVRSLLLVGLVAICLSPAGAVPAQAATSLGASAEFRWVNACDPGEDIYLAVHPVFEVPLLQTGVGEEQRYRMTTQSSCSVCPTGDVLLPPGAFVPASDLSGAELNYESCIGPVHFAWVAVGVPQPFVDTSFAGLRRNATVVGLEQPNVFAYLYEGLNL